MIYTFEIWYENECGVLILAPVKNTNTVKNINKPMSTFLGLSKHRLTLKGVVCVK